MPDPEAACELDPVRWCELGGPWQLDELWELGVLRQLEELWELEDREPGMRCLLGGAIARELEDTREREPKDTREREW